MPENTNDICIRLKVLNPHRLPLGGRVDLEFKPREAGETLAVKAADASKDIDVGGLQRAPKGGYTVTVTPTDKFKPTSQFVMVPASGFNTVEFVIDKGRDTETGGDEEGAGIKGRGTETGGDEEGAGICVRIRTLNPQGEPLGGTVDIEFKPKEVGDTVNVKAADASKDIDVRGLQRAPIGLYTVTVTPTDAFKPTSQFVMIPASDFNTVEFVIDKGRGTPTGGSGEGDGICVRIRALNPQGEPLGGTVDIEFKPKEVGDTVNVKAADASKDIDVRGLQRVPIGLYTVTVTPTDVFKPTPQFVTIPANGFDTVEFIIDKEGSTQGFVVRGMVRDANGTPLPGIFVRALDRDLRPKHSQQVGGTAVTNDRGFYEIRYAAKDFARAEAGGPDIQVQAFDSDALDRLLGESAVLFNAGKEATIDLTLEAQAERSSDFERETAEMAPLLKDQADGGGDLRMADLTEPDVEFIAADTGIDRQHIAWLQTAAAIEVKLTMEDRLPQGAVAGRFPVAIFYGWFRDGQPQQFSQLIDRPADELMASIDRAISRGIIPPFSNEQKDSIRNSLESWRIDEALRPGVAGGPASIGDALATMSSRLPPEKERIVAGILSDRTAKFDDLSRRLKDLNFSDQEIADVKVTRDLGDLTMNHPPLMSQLQKLREGGNGASVQYLSSQSTLDWLQLAFEHGAPALFVGNPEAYAEHLERDVDTRFPTAVFAARAKIDNLEFRDSALKTAADYLSANPDLELRDHNVRNYVNGVDGEMSDAQKEELVENLQKVQTAQKLTRNWREAGALLNAGFNSALKIFSQGRDAFIKAIGNAVPPERADEIYSRAIEIHDTSVALIGDLYSRESPWTPEIFRSRPTGSAEAPGETEQPVLDKYPNMRKLFGNLTMCLCQHCQSVLSPAAYLVDLMRFLDPPRSSENIGYPPLHYLLQRRPDIQHIELTCKNTNTEIPYIDLVLEVLENAIGLPIEIPWPYGFDPERDLQHTPLPDTVNETLRRILQRSAISVGERLQVEPLVQSTFNLWGITDGTRHWTLRHAPGLILTPFQVSLPTPDAEVAATMLDQGQLPDPNWVFERVSVWDKNLPVKETPIITTVKPGREWRVQYTRAVRVEAQNGSTINNAVLNNTNGRQMGSVVLKTINGEQLGQFQAHPGVLQLLVSRFGNGSVGEPLTGMLPPQYGYQVAQAGNEWEITIIGTLTLNFQLPRLAIDSLTYQSSDSRDDLKASPENRNPEAYRKLNEAVYPWTLPFDLWIEEVRVFLQRRGVPRLELMRLCNPSGGLTDDAIVRESLGLSLAEWNIISSLAIRPAWDYWGLKETANSVKDLNDESVVPGSWLQVLARVSILLQQSGLEFRELLNVFQTRFVRKESPVLEPGGDECNPSKMMLNNLKPGHLDRIHRFVRLWRKLGWSIFEVDLAISAVTGGNMDLNGATLHGLAQIHKLHELLGLPIYEIASWWATLTANYRDYTSEKRPIVKSVYERLFLNPVIVNPPDRNFSLNEQATELARTTGPLESKSPIIIAALGITRSDFQALIADLLARHELDLLAGQQIETSSLNLRNLSSLYRHVALAKALRLPVGEYLRLRSLIGSNPFASAFDALQFVENAQFIRRSGFSSEDLGYLMGYTIDAGPTALFKFDFVTETLSKVRRALQSTRKEILGSAEPLTDHLSKTLTLLGWYEELASEAVDLFASTSRFEVQIEGDKAVTVSIPAALNDRIIYRAQDRTLIGSLTLIAETLTADEWNELRNANSATNEVKDAIDILRTKVDTFAAALPKTLRRMQSFDLPTFTIEYNPSKPPSIPNELSFRCYFDADSKRIVLSGWLTDRQWVKLRDSLPAADAEIADDLKKDSNDYIEPEGPNRFLPDIDQIKPLFSAGETSETRVRKVLEWLLPYVYRRSLVETVSQAFDLDEGLVNELLLSQLNQQATLESLLDAGFADSDERVMPTFELFPAQFRALCKLHKAAFVCSTLKISRQELKWLPAATSQQTFDALKLGGLPSVVGENTPSLDAWRQLALLFALRDRRTIGQALIQRIIFFLNVQSPTDAQRDVDAQHAYLARALSSPLEDVQWAAREKLGLQWPVDYRKPARVAALFPLLINAWLARALDLSQQDSMDASGRLNLVWPADFQNPRKVTEWLELSLTAQRLGTKCSELFSLTEDAAPTGNNPGRPGQIEATLARGLLRARYDEKTWPAQLRRIVDTLRERQRDALVSYLIAHPPENAVNRGAWRNANDLYDHYLIDTEMSPCKVSTRILHAISAVQLFVQRCLMNIEEDVKPSAIDVDRLKWMKNYRVWEANRKVFLYPENWIEPELRDDKSKIFEELEGLLQQNELDHVRAEEALKEYLKQLESISNLMVVGMYVDSLKNSLGDLTGEAQIHVVARTLNRPSKFFYRRWILSATSNYWTAWERVPLDGVKTEHVLPFVFNGDPYIAWPEATQLAAPANSGSEQSSETEWRLQMAWIQRANGQWGDRYLNEDVIKHPWVYGKDVNSTFTFRVNSDQPGGVAIDCYGADRQSTGVQYHLPRPRTKDPDRIRLRIGNSGVTFQMQITVKGYISAEHKDLTDPNNSDKKAYAPVSNAYIFFYLDPSLYVGSWTDASVDSNIQNARKAVQTDYTRYGSQVWDGSRWAVVKEYDSMITNEDGYFSLSLSLPVTDKRHGMLREEVLEWAKPKFRLEITVDGKTHRPPSPFEYREQGDGNAYEEEHFYYTHVITREGPAPGSEVELMMKPIKRFRLLTSEDAVLESPSGDPLPPLDASVYGSGFRSNATDKLDVPEESTSVTLWTQETPLKHFLLPAAPVNLEAWAVLYYKSSESGYFIRKQTTATGANGVIGKYQILLDGDSRIRDLRRAVALDGPPALFGFEQENNTLVLAGPQPGTAVDVTTSFMQPAVRFEPDESSSPYAGYNTELRFHIPFLIGKSLGANQRFEEAQRWFHFIFDPTTSDSAPGVERYWRYPPFRKYSQTKPIDYLLKLLSDPDVPSDDEERRKVGEQIKQWLKNPFRPHAVARLRPRAYQFAVFFKYVSNLIEWGDQLFRQYTTESINEATQLYILASKLLGQRPQTVPRKTSPTPLTYARVNGQWDEFSNAWGELEANLPARLQSGLAWGGQGTSTISSIGSLYFCVPRNEKMLEYWDRLEERLFNIRHCRNIDGVEQPVPLFQPPIDPALLVRAVAAGLDIGAVLAEADTPQPHYRFGALSQKATELCNELKSLGGALLSALEKKDAEQLSLLRSGQELELLKRVRDVREQQLEEAKANIEALRQSEKLAAVRFAQYQRLLGKLGATLPEDDGADIEQASAAAVAKAGSDADLTNLGLTQAELNQIQMSEEAMRYAVTVGILNTASGIAYAIPTIQAGSMVLSNHFGGLNIGSALSAVSAFLSTLERNASHQANRAATIGQHQRRQDEWVFQSRMALKEVQQIRKQIIAAQIRQEIAIRELANHDKQIKNAEESDRFMREKYTNRELYQWMVQQISAVYFRSYQLAREVAKRAEQAFRFELGIQDTNYIQVGYWDSLKKGLFAGEMLSHDLKRMEVAYLDQNRREYEITRHISLLSLDPIALIKLRQTGQCEVEIPEEVFDLDYSGHYLRRIKSVSLTIPCVSGPYTTISCTLRLLKNSIRINTADGDNGYARNRDEDGLPTDDQRFIENNIPVKAIAASSGQNDSGVFELNFRDERYLPFEGSGVISSWRLEMPSEIRQFDYDTISDVILHIRYTAREGGQTLKDKAAANLRTQIAEARAAGMVRLFSVRHEFPGEWAKFKNAKLTDNVQTAELSLPLREEHYPYWSKGRVRSVINVEALAKVLDDTEEITVTSAAGPGADDPNGEDEEAPKVDILSGSPIQGLLQGTLSRSKPAEPFNTSDPPDPIRLYFDNNKSIEELWLAVTWGERSSEA